MSPPTNFIFVGVGGQGAILAAGVFGEAVFRRGLQVAVTQLHGMSQRGGSVHAGVTVGTTRVLSMTRSPIDVLVGLELLEAVRVADRIRPGGTVLCNDQVVPPPEASRRRQGIPPRSELVAELEHRAGRVELVPGRALAEEAGHSSVVNAVMLGALSRLAQCPVERRELLAVLLEQASSSRAENNRRAFLLGARALG